VEITHDARATTEVEFLANLEVGATLIDIRVLLVEVLERDTVGFGNGGTNITRYDSVADVRC